MTSTKQLFREVERIKKALVDDGSNPTIDKEDAIAIVKVVLSHHLHPDYNEELKSEVFSKWDWEIFSISKEISKAIREFE